MLTYVVINGRWIISDNEKSGKVSNNEVYKGKVELVLVSLLDSYLDLESISVNASKPSSSFLSYSLLTT